MHKEIGSEDLENHGSRGMWGCRQYSRNIAVKMLALSGVFSDVLIGDINLTKAQKLASTLGANVSAIKVDALNSSNIEKAISGSSVVLNFVAPFYKFGPSVMKTAMLGKLPIRPGFNLVCVFHPSVCQREVDLRLPVAINTPIRALVIPANVNALRTFA